MDHSPHADLAGGMPRRGRRSPLTWLLIAGAVGILLVIVAFAASGGLGSPAPVPVLRPDNGALQAPSTQTTAPVPTPSPPAAPPPQPEGKHHHGGGGG